MKTHFNCTINNSSFMVIGRPDDYQSLVMIDRDQRQNERHINLESAMNCAANSANAAWNCDVPDMTVREFRNIIDAQCAAKTSNSIPSATLNLKR